jgi:hypothetical protein
MNRTIRKAAVELLPAIAVTVIGYLLDNAAEVGLSTSAVWALLQARRVLRDVANGQPR